MKVLTAAQMREVDRRTIEAGIPGIILMENAAHRVVEYMASRFAPLSQQRIVVFCGKGNNGGDGLAIARQLHTRFAGRTLDVVLTAPAGELQPDAAANLAMLQAAGVKVQHEITPPMLRATLVVDALLGTGLKGPAGGRALEFIRQINNVFPEAKVVAVDIPSGMMSDSPGNQGPCARADATVTFTAPKLCHVLPPNCDGVGELVVAPIGSPPSLFEDDPDAKISLVERRWFGPLFGPRPRAAHKGNFGHVLAVAGAVGKTGAAAMTGLSALRAGAGLVTVASAASAIATIACYAPELMTEPLQETPSGSVSLRAHPAVQILETRMSVLAVGPGLGTHPDTSAFVRILFEKSELPAVFDADGINAIAGAAIRPGGPRVLTPHPGEMARLQGCSIAEIQANRLESARSAAISHHSTIVLKGQRTIIAFPDGHVWINPTGTPALATGGSGDILTGLIAGLMAQFPNQTGHAIGAAVWLHGRAGELGVAELGEKALVATDLLRFLPEAMRELAGFHCSL